MRCVLWLFPRAWHERYGDEVLELLALSERKPRDCIDLVLSALSLRIDSAIEWREGGMTDRPRHADRRLSLLPPLAKSSQGTPPRPRSRSRVAQKPKPDSFAGVRADVTSTAGRRGPFAVAS